MGQWGRIVSDAALEFVRNRPTLFHRGGTTSHPCQPARVPVPARPCPHLRVSISEETVALLVGVKGSLAEVWFRSLITRDRASFRVHVAVFVSLENRLFKSFARFFTGRPFLVGLQELFMCPGSQARRACLPASGPGLAVCAPLRSIPSPCGPCCGQEGASRDARRAHSTRVNEGQPV